MYVVVHAIKSSVPVQSAGRQAKVAASLSDFIVDDDESITTEDEESAEDVYTSDEGS